MVDWLISNEGEVDKSMMDLRRYREVSQLKLVQTRWKWKCQWRISGLARKQNAEKSRRQLHGGVDVSRSEPAGPTIPLLCLWIRHSEINDAPPNIPKYPATKIRYPMTRCRNVQKRACGRLSPPIARKMTRKMPPPLDPPASVCAVRSYLRCNRSVDENFLPGIRGTVSATADAVGPVLALRFA